MNRLPRLILVGCGARKLPHAAPAKDLYTGSLFRAARAYAETHADAWYILSAKYGLVHPDHVIEPYDVYLPRLSAAERQALLAQIAPCLDSQGYETVTLLASAAYCDLVRPLLANRQVVEPLAGMSIGQRNAWLRAALKKSYKK